MLRQSYILFIRLFSKDKLFSFINISNLIIGYATFILLSLFLQEEFSWDKQNKNYDNIYRLQLYMDQSENVTKHSSSVTAAISRQILPGLPEIEKIALIHDVGDNNKDGVFLSVDRKNEFLTRYGYYADQSVFDIFTFHFIEGDQSNALTQAMSIVLSETVSKKLFPNGGAIGKEVYGENKVVFTVTGIFEDLPLNSEWRPVYLLPMNSFAAITNFKDYETNFWAYSFYTYVLLKKDASPTSVDAKIKDCLKDYRKEHQPYLRPLSKLHLNAYFEKGYYIGMGLISLIAILILSLSSINYINLQTANATTRLKEIGVKKTFGFSKSTLIFQFISETLLLSAIASLLGLLLAQMALPIWNWILDKEIFHSILDYPATLLIILIVTLITGLFSGLFPAFVISSFNPVAALKQKFLNEKAGSFSLKKLLMTIQFTISIFLIITTFMVYKQTHYMMNRDMGFDSKNILYANIITEKKGSVEFIRNRLLAHPEITDACLSDYIPFILPGGDDLNWAEQKTDEKVFIRVSNVSYDFLDTYKIGVYEGRNFSHEYPADIEKCLINKTANRVFQWEEPIGKIIHLWGKDYEVIGVINDYIHFSVNNMIEPHMYKLIPDSTKLDGIYSISFRPGTGSQVRKIVSQEFAEIFPDDAFEFRNIDNLIKNENAVRAWKSFNKICVSVTILSILISSIGLFGLVLFQVRRKLKEIGMRKVLGFTNLSLYSGLSYDFMKLLLFSIVFAWPAGYYVYKTLPSAYKCELQIWEFLIPTIIIFLVALFTISLMMLKVSRLHPSEILRDE
jgi:putative ABC transport system permease protein